MKLSGRERQVLSVIQLNAKASVPEIADVTGLKQTTVRNTLSKLTDLDFLHQSIFVNQYALGFEQFGIFFSVNPHTNHSYDDFAQKIIDCENVYFLGELGGEFQYAMNTLFPSIAEFNNFLNDFSTNFGANLIKKDIHLIQELALYGCKYLWPENTSPTTLYRKATANIFTPDELDHQILSRLARDGSLSIRQLARALGEKQNTVSYRLQRMEKENVIAGHFYIAESARFGLYPFVFLLEVSDLASTFRKQLESFLAEHLNVDLWIRSIGIHDYHIAAFFDSFHEALELGHDLRTKFPEQVQSLSILPRFRLLKSCDYPFVNFPF